MFPPEDFSNAIDVFIFIGALYATMNIEGFYEKLVNFFDLPQTSSNNIGVEIHELASGVAEYATYRKVNAIHSVTFFMVATLLVINSNVKVLVFLILILFQFIVFYYFKQNENLETLNQQREDLVGNEKAIKKESQKTEHGTLIYIFGIIAGILILATAFDYILFNYYEIIKIPAYLPVGLYMITLICTFIGAVRNLRHFTDALKNQNFSSFVEDRQNATSFPADLL